MLRKIMMVGAASLLGIMGVEAKTSGCVTDTNGNPVAGALVEIKDTSLSQLTDAEGKFDFGETVYGETLFITADGYDKKKVNGSGVFNVQLHKTTWWTAKPHWQLFAGLQVQQPTKSLRSITPGVMVGYVKNVGVYAKGYILPGNAGNESEYGLRPDFTNGKVRFNNKGFMAGIMVRLGCPLYLYAGGGSMWYECAAQEFDGSWNTAFSARRNVNEELGLMFKYKYLSINASVVHSDGDWYAYEGLHMNDGDIDKLSFSVGVSYWFNF